MWSCLSATTTQHARWEVKSESAHRAEGKCQRGKGAERLTRRRIQSDASSGSSSVQHKWSQLELSRVESRDIQPDTCRNVCVSFVCVWVCEGIPQGCCLRHDFNFILACQLFYHVCVCVCVCLPLKKLTHTLALSLSFTLSPSVLCVAQQETVDM